MSVPGWPIGLIFFLVIGLSIEHLFEHIHYYHQSLSSWSKWSDFDDGFCHLENGKSAKCRSLVGQLG